MKFTLTALVSGCLLLAISAPAATNVPPLTAMGQGVLKAAGSPWLELETPHFILHAATTNLFAEGAAQAEFAYKKAGLFLEATEGGRGHLFLIDDPKLWERAIEAEGRRGDAEAAQSEADLFILVGPDTFTYAVQIPHEIVHFRMWQAYGTNAPIWLDEGVAGYAGWKITESYHGLQGHRLVQIVPPESPKRLQPLDEVTAAKDMPRSPKAAQVFCRQATELIAAIAKRLGDGKLGGFVAAVAGRGAEWTASLRSDYSWTTQEIVALDETVRSACLKPE